MQYIEQITQENALDVINQAYRHMKDNQHMVDGIKQEIADLKERLDRYKKRVDDDRKTMQRAMDIMGENKLVTALFTASVRKSKPKIQIIDESKIPGEYFIPQEPKLDKTRLTDDIVNNGVVIEGATISNQAPTLAIREK